MPKRSLLCRFKNVHLIIRFAQPIVERVVISRERIHARAILCVLYPRTRLSSVTDGDSCEDDYMVSAPYNEPGRIPRRYLHSAPRNHPLKLAQGCVPDKWSAILLSYQWPDFNPSPRDRQHSPRSVKPLIFTALARM